MAILERSGTKIRCHLLTRHIVGRSSLAHLRLADPNVSAEHAIVGFTGRGWEVHDLGSRNGTTLDGRRLGQGERAPLARGAAIGFGSAAQVWHFVDDGPPAVLALPVDGGEPAVGEHDLLALPSADEPEAMVYRDGAGAWLLDRDGDAEPIASGREVTVGGRRFVLHLPEIVAPTLDVTESPPALEGITLAFGVSRDEEHIGLHARAGERSIDLGARVHNALLLALARARLSDQRQGLPETSQGWVYQDDLAKGLGLDEAHLNVTIFRCRQHVSASGIAGAASIVERRKLARQLRLGVRRIEIDVL